MSWLQPSVDISPIYLPINNKIANGQENAISQPLRKLARSSFWQLLESEGQRLERVVFSLLVGEGQDVWRSLVSHPEQLKARDDREQTGAGARGIDECS